MSGTDSDRFLFRAPLFYVGLHCESCGARFKAEHETQVYCGQCSEGRTLLAALRDYLSAERSEQ